MVARINKEQSIHDWVVSMEKIFKSSIRDVRKSLYIDPGRSDVV
jgi:hypothetical protein